MLRTGFKSAVITLLMASVSLLLPVAAYARCAYVAVQSPFSTPTVAPGPAPNPCFNLEQRCSQRYGCFKTQLRLSKRFIPGRTPPMKRLEARFGYIDPAGMHWDVPVGYLTDGATIPPGLKAIVGSSWNSHYIRAAVIHDYYIDHAKQTVASEAVHRVFFHALLASGVQPYWAHWMYRAVRKHGPRWKTIDLARSNQVKIDNERARQRFNQQFFERYQRCLKQRQARLRQDPLNRSLTCPLNQADELLYSLAKITVDAVQDAVRQQRQGNCVLGSDGIWDCSVMDRRHRPNR